jgi:hypothetical protein
MSKFLLSLIIAFGIMGTFVLQSTLSKSQDVECSDFLSCLCVSKNHTRQESCTVDDAGYIIDTCKKDEYLTTRVTKEYDDCVTEEIQAAIDVVEAEAEEAKAEAEEAKAEAEAAKAEAEAAKVDAEGAVAAAAVAAASAEEAAASAADAAASAADAADSAEEAADSAEEAADSAEEAEEAPAP